ncbi:M23 family metallopeptidase [Nitriliruptoraceae bacterium ZYF776]|nr:M23 family metallopeptidase [Profundirhabdus halotolerans]
MAHRSGPRRVDRPRRWQRGRPPRRGRLGDRDAPGAAGAARSCRGDPRRRRARRLRVRGGRGLRPASHADGGTAAAAFPDPGPRHGAERAGHQGPEPRDAPVRADLRHRPRPRTGPRGPTRLRGSPRVPGERGLPSFGEPVHAPAAGRVAIARDRARDHRARSNLLAYPYLVVEGFVRQSLGAGRLLGNHLVIDLDGGGSVVLAHLQRGSVRVSVGDRVEAGEVVARVGNSGNSSEPHLHLQLADRTRPSVSAGLPFVFSDVVVDDAETTPTSAPTPVVPEDGRPFHGGVTGSASRP